MQELRKQTTENMVAIRELTQISKNTSENVNKMATKMDKLIPINEALKALSNDIIELKTEAKLGIRPKTLKNLLVYSVVLIISFSTTITAYIAIIDKQVAVNVEKHEYTEIKQNLLYEDVQKNKNQISYNKGRLATLKNVLKGKLK